MKVHHKPKVIEYPDSDGQPMAEDTLHFEYITTIQGGLDALFRDDPQVFVAGDLLWYPVEGRPDVRTAPDVMVAFGRPKGYRGSYCQWMEANIAPQVVFEVLSPGNRFPDLMGKFQFYLDHGVEEYYVYNFNRGDLLGWQRADAKLEEISQMAGWVSPRLGIRFSLESGRLVLQDPAGKRFYSYVELASLVEQAQRRAELKRPLATQERQNAAQERQLAAQENQRAEQEHQRAEQERQRADQERQRAEQESLRAERLAARLRELGEVPEE